MKKVGLRQVFNLLAFLGTVTINGLANALPINGQTTGEISDRFAVYFVPAGYVFSIWGLIYWGCWGLSYISCCRRRGIASAWHALAIGLS